MRTISIKFIISFLIITLAIVGCKLNADISGTLVGKHKNGLHIYLIKPQSLWDLSASYFGKVIDSAFVNSDGSFEFNNIRAKQPLLLELAIQVPNKPSGFLETKNISKSNYMPIVWQPGKHIQIAAKVDEFQKTFSLAYYSQLNKALFDLRDSSQKAYQTYIAGKHWNVEDGRQLMAKEYAIFQYQKTLIKFADSTSYFLPAMVALRWVSPEKDYERIPEFLVRQATKWSKVKPNMPWVEQLRQESDPSKLPVLIGDVFPNIEVPTMSNKIISIRDKLGKKLTIIDLWASWCAPCRIENREVLDPIWNKYHNKGLQIIGYGLESDRDTWKQAARNDGSNRWLQISDLKGDYAPFLNKIRVQTIPTNFILNHKGVVLAKNVHGKALMKLVKKYVNR